MTEEINILPSSNYYNYNNASLVAKFFHSFPHYDLSFNEVPAVFDPNNQKYQEALMIIAAVPILWMLLWIVIYTIYFCYFCITCRTNYEKKTKSARPERWLTFMFSLMTLLFLTAAVFGNEMVSNGVRTVTAKIAELHEDSHNVKVQGALLLHRMDNLVASSTEIEKMFVKYTGISVSDRTALLNASGQLIQQLSGSLNVLQRNVQDPFIQMNLTSPIATVEVYEEWRRLGTHLICGLVMLCMTFMLCAVGSKRKCCILMCVGIVIFNLFLTWITLGFYTGVTVATADVCVDPSGYLNNSPDFNTDNSMDGWSLSRYYLECPPGENPIAKGIFAVQQSLIDANRTLTSMHGPARPLGNYSLQIITESQKNISAIMSQLLRLLSSTECKDSHRSYNAVVHALCETAINGEAVVVGSYALSGLFLIVLVFLAHAAARFVPTRRAYFEVESREEDYPAREQNDRTDNPLYYRFSQISTGDGGDNRVSQSEPTAPPRNSPPPAYHSHGQRDFYSSYGNQGTLDSNTNVPTNDLNSNGNTFR